MDGKVAFDLLSRAHRSCEMESPSESEAWQTLKFAAEISDSIQKIKMEAKVDSTEPDKTSKCQHKFFPTNKFGFVECRHCGETYAIELWS
jgi:hypothetical protein